jgi:ankyrin repeat protein
MSIQERIAELWRELDREGGISLVRQIFETDLLEAKLSPFGFTLLHVTATEGDCDLARSLLAAGADVNAIDSVGETPLYRAAWQRHPEMCRLLLLAGARRDIPDRHNRTPLDAALIGDPWVDLAVKEQTIWILQHSE